MKQKQNWSHEQDQSLKRLVQAEHNSVNWIYLTQEFNRTFSNRVRTPIECQQRYINYLSHLDDPHIVNDWSAEETDLLFKLFDFYGSKWTKIAQLMHGKTQNCVKNRFYGSLRKALRKMNRAAKNLIKKFKKQLKYESITRIIDASEGLYRLHSPLKEQSYELSRKILALAKRSQEEMPCEEAEELILEINKFNMATRSYKSKKKIKNHCGCSIKQKCCESLSKSQNLNSTFHTLNSVKIQTEMESEQEYHSTDEENEDFPTAFLSTSGTMADFSSREDNKLKDYQIEQQNRLRRKSMQSVQELFAENTSPLQCQLWI